MCFIVLFIFNLYSCAKIGFFAKESNRTKEDCLKTFFYSPSLFINRGGVYINTGAVYKQNQTSEKRF